MTDARVVDETQALLAAEAGTGDTESSLPALTLVESSAGVTTAADFLAKDDPDNPLNWPSAFKWGIVYLLAFMAFTVTFTCISVVPVAAHIVEELDGRNGEIGGGSNVRVASVLLVTIWELGEAAGPLAIAPLSETASWGRSKVLNGATILFALATAAAALAPSTVFFIAARGLTGLAVATNVLNPAIVGDIFPPDQRGTAMALIQLAPLLGGAIGPAIGGAVADTWGWRSVLWVSTGLAAASTVLVWLTFRETYPPAVARRRGERNGKAAVHTVASSDTLVSDVDAGANGDARDNDEEAAAAKLLETSPTSSGLSHIRDAVLRPLVVLTDSFVLGLLAVYGAVLFSFFYVMSVSLPDILENRYGLTSAATGSFFMVFSFGAFVSIILCNRSVDKIYVYLTKTRGRLSADGTRVGCPEFRLPLSCICGILLPTSVALYGWSAELRLPLPVLLVAECLIGASMALVFLPLAAYTVDAFGLYAASALTGLIVLRCLCGTFFPLSVAPLVDIFGYGWGFTVLAGVCILVGPIPAVVFVYGEKWRQRSKYTRDA